jgi:hypothetical protein
MERNVTASEQSIYSSYREMLLEQKDVGSSPITRSPKKPMESRRTATQGEWPVVVILVMCTECVPSRARGGVRSSAPPPVAARW